MIFASENLNAYRFSNTIFFLIIMLPSINQIPFPNDKQIHFNQTYCLNFNSNNKNSYITQNTELNENTNLINILSNTENSINFPNNQMNDIIFQNNLKFLNQLQNDIKSIQNQINKMKKTIINNNKNFYKNKNSLNKEQIGHIKGFWSHDEDELLIKAVKETNPCVWEIVASKVPGRSPIQCKERWLYRLHPGVNKAKFEKWEDDIIINERNRIGNSWTYISTKLNGRTPLAVKNRWYLFLKKELKS